MAKDLLKPILWRGIYHSKDLHLGISLKLRGLLKDLSYKKNVSLNDLQEYRVQINIAAYNAEKWIGDTLKAIQNQTFANWKVCIVDDGSTDSTAEVVKSFALKDKRFHLYHNVQNSGSNLTRNAGLEIAENDPSWNVLAVVDADDVPFPHWLETGLKGIKNGASVVRCINTRCSSDLSQKYYDYMSCAQIFATRKIINAVGYYRQQPFLEDYDFIERLEKAALILKSYVVTTPVTCQLMRIHGDNSTLQPKKPEQLACNEHSHKLAKEATDLNGLYVKGIIPTYTAYL